MSYTVVEIDHGDDSKIFTTFAECKFAEHNFFTLTASTSCFDFFLHVFIFFHKNPHFIKVKMLNFTGPVKLQLKPWNKCLLIWVK